MKQKCILLLLFLGFQSAYSQNFEIGANIGYGRTFNLQELFSQTSKLSVGDFQIGFISSFLPDSMFSINSGVSVDRIGTGNRSIDFLQVPAGIDLLFGKKIQGLIGFGFNISYLFNADVGFNPDFNSHHSDFMFGGYLNAGMKFKVSPGWNIYWKGLFEADFTPLYKEEIPDHFGNTSFKSYRSYGYSIHAGVTYRITNKVTRSGKPETR